jgi:hypothetical protein
MCSESPRCLELVLLLALLATEAKPMDFSYVSSRAEGGVLNKEDYDIKERGLVFGDCRAAGLSWGRYPGLLGGRLLVEVSLV